MVSRVANDGIASASEILFGGTRDGRIERRENEVAVEREVEAFDDEIPSDFWNERVKMPANGFRVGLAGRTLGGGNFGELEPWVVGEQVYETLTDDTGGTEYAGAPLFISGPYRRVLIAPYCGVFHASLGRFR